MAAIAEMEYEKFVWVRTQVLEMNEKVRRTLAGQE